MRQEKMEQFDLTYTGFINYGENYLDTRTGEILTQQEFSNWYQTRANSIKVYTDGKRLHPISILAIRANKDSKPPKTIYKHLNSLQHTKTALGIKEKRCDLINKVYQQCSATGVLTEHPSLAKNLGKDWKRSLRTLEKDNWIKRMSSVDKLSTIGKETDIVTYWMINPIFTTTRDRWKPTRQQWLIDGYENGVLISYKQYKTKNDGKMNTPKAA